MKIFRYIEMAILSSYRFIQHTSFPAVINRIALQIKGIGNPLVSMYARTYLARKGYEVEPLLKDYVVRSFYDYLDATLRLDKSKVEQEVKRLHLTPSEYHNLFSPALDWQLQCIGHNGNEVFFFLFKILCTNLISVFFFSNSCKVFWRNTKNARILIFSNILFHRSVLKSFQRMQS